MWGKPGRDAAPEPSISAGLGGTPATRAVLRVLVGGALGLAVTYGIGHPVGGAIS